MSGSPLNDNKFQEFLRSVRDSGEPTVDALFADLYAHIRGEAHRQIARERSDHTLQATELVSEAYLRLKSAKGVDWQGYGHVRRLVARAIRHVLIDWARKRASAAHGGGAVMVTLVTAQGKTATPIEDILALDAALEELAAGPGNMAREAQVVELYFFLGATPEEIAKELDLSERQVYRDYKHARAWLHLRLSS